MDQNNYNKAMTLTEKIREAAGTAGRYLEGLYALGVDKGAEALELVENAQTFVNDLLDDVESVATARRSEAVWNESIKAFNKTIKEDLEEENMGSDYKNAYEQALANLNRFRAGSYEDIQDND